MQIYTKENESGAKSVRAEGKFDFPASIVAEYACGKFGKVKFLDPEIRCEIDKMFNEAKIVEEIGSGLGYEYCRMKGAFIFSDRDVCTIRHRKEEESGRIIVTAYSKEHPDCGEQSGAVRATVNILSTVYK
jgi:hypothetical protein